MRRLLMAAAGVVALAAGAAGVALAQGEPPRGERGEHGFFGADANNDGVLTRAEFDAGQDAMFARLDSNHDGQLSREERRAHRGDRHGGRRGHGRGGPGGPGFGLERADANNDGNITREEFLARPNEMFDHLDQNHDGVIQASERPQRPPEGERGGPPGERGGPGRDGPPNVDSNNDGVISRAEFLAGGAARFQRMDANHDGRVTREEAEAARPPHGPPPQ